MISYLVALLRSFRVAAVELAGSGVAVAGVAQFSHRAAFVVAGCLLLLKSMEMDLRRDKGGEK